MSCTGPDKIRFSNQNSNTIGPIYDGAENGTDFNDRTVTTTPIGSNEVNVWDITANSQNNEIAAFQQGRAPKVVNPATWTNGTDWRAVNFEEPIEIGVTLWVVTGDLWDRVELVLGGFIYSMHIWDTERMGIALYGLALLETGEARKFLKEKANDPGFYYQKEAAELLNLRD